MSRRAALLTGALVTLVTFTAGCAPKVAASKVPTPAPSAQLVPALRDQLPQKVKDSGVLRVGTNASYAPITSYGPDGRTLIGMEPDLAAEIGQVLGIQLQFVAVPFSEILPQVADGRLDLGLSAITDTPQRRMSADFVNYFRAGTSILVQNGNPDRIHDLEDLCGRRVAAESGTVQVDLVQRTQPACLGRPIELQTFPTNADALLQLRTGRVTAVLNDFPPARHLVRDDRTRPYYELASSTQYEPGLYGVAVPKGQPELRDALQQAIALLIRSGRYREVLRSWDVSAGAVSEITVNSGQ